MFIYHVDIAGATVLSVLSDENSVMHVRPEGSLLPTTSTGAAIALHADDSSPLQDC